MRRCLCCTAVIVVSSPFVQANVTPVDRTDLLGGFAIESLTIAEPATMAVADIDAPSTATLASGVPFVLTFQPALALCIGLAVSARWPRRCVA
ncbi:MAG: hypothetical protein QM783_06235 [Phycisphaerales bacterium]